MEKQLPPQLGVTSLFGFRFVHATREAIIERVVAMAHERYAYVITPNVDFVVQAQASPATRALFDGAAIQMCDSRVLRLAASMLGEELVCLPGSNLVAHLMAQPANGLRYCLIGPDVAVLPALRAHYPQRDLTVLPAPPRFRPGDEAWGACIAAAAAAEWDILLVCLGTPKEVAFAADLASVRVGSGVALCVGASIDFLTGKQRRAPRWMQRFALEWLFRLLSEPKRLWRRYLVDDSKFLMIVIRTWWARLRRR